LPAAPRMEKPVAGALSASAFGAPKPPNTLDEPAALVALLALPPKPKPNLEPESEVGAATGVSAFGAVDAAAPKMPFEPKEKELGTAVLDANGLDPAVALTPDVFDWFAVGAGVEVEGVNENEVGAAGVDVGWLV